MKKVTLSTFAAIFLLASAFADSDKRVVHSINISVPVQMENWKNDTSFFYVGNTEKEKNDVMFSGINFNWNRMTVNDGGFSFFVSLFTNILEFSIFQSEISNNFSKFAYNAMVF